MKSPAFRFYPADFMGSPDVQAMDLHEVGSYLFLLCMAWQSDRHGYLPDDEGKLRRWAKMNHDQWEQSREVLLSKFPVAEPGWRQNPRMVLEAEKQSAFAESQKRKAEIRWNKGHKPEQSQIDAPAYAPASIPDARGMPSVSVSVSVFEEEQKQEQEPSSPAVPQPDASRSGGELIPFQAVKTPKTKAPKVKPEDPRVLEVYGHYPRKDGKQPALIAIAKALDKLIERNDPDPVELLCARIDGWQERLQRQRAAEGWAPNYPHPATWFNNGDWDLIENDPVQKAEPHTLTEAEAREKWEKDFGRRDNGTHG